MTPLPMADNDGPRVVSCQNCGKCCETQGTPPELFFVYGDPALVAAQQAGVPLREWPRSEWFAALPDDAREAIFAALEDETRDDGAPCCWYDERTNLCRWYEHRPEICRDFEVGSEACLTWRGDR